MSVEYQEQLMKSGSFTAAGTPAAVSVTLGFQPSFIKFFTDDTTVFTGEYYDGMADASFVKLISHDTAQLAKITSNGVTVSSTGFTLGTACQVASKVTYWQAFR